MLYASAVHPTDGSYQGSDEYKYSEYKYKYLRLKKCTLDFTEILFTRGKILKYRYF